MYRFHSSRFGRIGRSLLAVILIVAFLVSMLFALSRRSYADSTCTICHKRTTTLVVTCGSLDYQRHKDHGDTDGACSASQ